MEVSRSGYYQYLKTDHHSQIDKDFELLSKVRQIHGETRGAYGSRRTSERLRSQGNDVGRYRARSLMKKAGVSVKLRNMRGRSCRTFITSQGNCLRQVV
ncbi:MAG: IS3 family transposase [Thermodesulfobacteriota bacterium]